MKNHIINGILIAFLLGFSLSCDEPEKEELADDVIVRVHDAELTKNEVNSFVPDNMMPADSLELADSYIRQWINTELLFNKAQTELHDTSNIHKKIQEFRKQLYIHEFEKEYLDRKLDSLVPMSEVREYYEKHLTEYVLDKIAVKAHYLIMDVGIVSYYPELTKVRRSEPDDMEDLRESVGTTNKEIVEHKRWIYLDDLLREMNTTMNPEIRSGFDLGYFTCTDTANRYIVKINEKAMPGDTMPLDLIEGKISSIIMNKRKQELLADLKSTLKQNARSQENLIENEN
ncbi:MAG: hypothetical protein ACQES0_09785 [Bacteroidota bacterium]